MVQRFFCIQVASKKGLTAVLEHAGFHPISPAHHHLVLWSTTPMWLKQSKKAIGCEAGRVAIESIFLLRPNAQQCPSGLSVRHNSHQFVHCVSLKSTRDPTNQCMHASLYTRRVLATYASSVAQSANQQPAITIHTSSVGFSIIFHDIQTTDIPSPVPSSASAVCILAHRAPVPSIRPSRPAHDHSLCIPVNAIINIYPVMDTEPTSFLSSASDSQPPIYPAQVHFLARTRGRVPSTHNLTIIGAGLTFSRALFEERVYGRFNLDTRHCREKNRRAGAIGHTFSLSLSLSLFLSLSPSLSLECIVAASLARCSNPTEKLSDTLISRLGSKLDDIC
jgi:hypothetical protein